MSLKTIYVTRHGFRSNWVVDAETGTYSTTIPSPTGIPSDPALAGYGVDQSHELAAHLKTLSPPIERIYSSPFYRCIQTIAPTVASLNKVHSSEDKRVQVRLENGVGEWYGTARFDHPSPAATSLLSSLFPENLIDESYSPTIVPATNGESIRSLHDRCAYALHRLIEQSDAEGVEAICICTHAASLIAIGRALVGRMPDSIEEEDFRPFTCGLSVFTRKSSTSQQKNVEQWQGEGNEIPETGWRGGNGVGGGWNLDVSGDCSFLSGGEERGWRFSGNESFLSVADKAAGLDAGSGLGVVVEGKTGEKAKSGGKSPARL